MTAAGDPEQLQLPEIKHVPWSVRAPYMFRWRGRRYFSLTEAEAKRRRRELLSGSPTMTKREQEEFLHCRELLEGVPLRTAVRFYLEHRSTTPAGRTMRLQDAVEEFIGLPVAPPPLAPGAQREFLAAGAFRGRRKYVTEGRRNLRLLARRLGDRLLAEITTETLSEALSSVAGYNTRVDLRKYASVFFSWCVKQRRCAFNPAKELRIADDRTDDREGEGARDGFITVLDVQLLLDVARTEFPAIAAGLALQAFLGIRTFEVTRLLWGQIRPGVLVDIREHVAKMGERRVIDWWPPNLSAWLPVNKPDDAQRVVPASYMRIRHAAIKRCQTIRARQRQIQPAPPAFAFPQNCLRHAFATFGVALLQSADKIALALGHKDAQLLFKTYRDYAAQEDGQAYFAVRPRAVLPALVPGAVSSTSPKRSSRITRR